MNTQWSPFHKPLASNQIPMSRLSPATQVLYAITPPPTTSANPLVTTNINIVNPSFVDGAKHYLPPGSCV